MMSSARWGTGARNPSCERRSRGGPCRATCDRADPLLGLENRSRVGRVADLFDDGRRDDQHPAADLAVHGRDRDALAERARPRHERASGGDRCGYSAGKSSARARHASPAAVRLTRPAGTPIAARTNSTRAANRSSACTVMVVTPSGRCCLRLRRRPARAARRNRGRWLRPSRAVRSRSRSCGRPPAGHADPARRASCRS